MTKEKEYNLKYRMSTARVAIFLALKRLEDEAGCKVTGLEHDGGKIKIMCEMEDGNAKYKITSTIKA